jgi:hypothetical protein
MNGVVPPGDQPGLPSFEECLEGRFRVEAAPDTFVELTLIEAMALPTRGNPARVQPFSVVFRGPVSHPLPQRSYMFEHETLGIFEMFIVPIEPDEHGPRYEAIFN